MPPWLIRFVSCVIGLVAGFVTNPATFGLGATKEMSIINISFRLSVVIVVSIISYSIGKSMKKSK